MYVYTCVCVCVFLCVCVCVCVFSCAWALRTRWVPLWIRFRQLLIHMCTYSYIYMYVPNAYVYVDAPPVFWICLLLHNDNKYIMGFAISTLQHTVRKNNPISINIDHLWCHFALVFWVSLWEDHDLWFFAAIDSNWILCSNWTHTSSSSYTRLQIGWHRIARLFLEKFNKPQLCPRFIVSIISQTVPKSIPWGSWHTWYSIFRDNLKILCHPIGNRLYWSCLMYWGILLFVVFFPLVHAETGFRPSFLVLIVFCLVFVLIVSFFWFVVCRNWVQASSSPRVPPV